MVCEDVVEVSVRLGIVLQNINKLVSYGLYYLAFGHYCEKNSGKVIKFLPDERDPGGKNIQFFFFSFYLLGFQH
jgi:hypothetical protein